MTEKEQTAAISESAQAEIPESSETVESSESSVYQPIVRIVDDDESVRRSIRYSLLVDGIACKTFDSAQDFLLSDDIRHPGCLVLDLTMPGMSGLELQEEMIHRGIDLPILFLSGNGDVPSVVKALKNGAVDFLEKPFEPDDLRQRVLELNEQNVRNRDKQNRIDDIRKRYALLTKREKLVIGLVAKNMMNKEIAEMLHITEHTVKVHRGSACEKLEIRTTLEIYALLQAIGELPE